MLYVKKQEILLMKVKRYGFSHQKPKSITKFDTDFILSQKYKNGVLSCYYTITDDENALSFNACKYKNVNDTDVFYCEDGYLRYKNGKKGVR